MYTSEERKHTLKQRGSQKVCTLKTWVKGRQVLKKGEDIVGRWRRECKEQGICTKRTGKLLMKASRMALSTNAQTHTH